jgi:hypothetical protein
MLGPEFIQSFLTEARPLLVELLKEIIDQERSPNNALVVDYDEAGRMMGTTYEGIRKMVSKGQLKSVKRGRRKGIAVAELKSYVQKNTN